MPPKYVLCSMQGAQLIFEKGICPFLQHYASQIDPAFNKTNEVLPGVKCCSAHALRMGLTAHADTIICDACRYCAASRCQALLHRLKVGQSALHPKPHMLVIPGYQWSNHREMVQNFINICEVACGSPCQSWE